MRFFSPASSSPAMVLAVFVDDPFRLATRPYVVRRRPARNEADHDGGFIRSKLNNKSMTVSRIVVNGSVKDDTRDFIARNSYMDSVKRPGHDFMADDIAFAFCFKVRSLVYEESV